ncbi:hypothetical protein CPC08DRAFT_716619 [Agrocybe pediades]|nr:hypothetical protein CPC08DRAFT_716619 [Agrocybe pediades]
MDEIFHQSPEDDECAQRMGFDKCQVTGCIEASLGGIHYCEEHALLYTNYGLIMQGFLDGSFRGPPLAEPMGRSSATGHSRISYRKTKTAVETPAGYEFRLHSDLNVQCGLVYTLSANPELRGKICGRWFRDTSHFNAHVKLLQGHNLYVGKSRSDKWVCTWSGCEKEMPANELWRHITAFHVGARYRCRVCGHATAPRIDIITNHLRVKHDLGTTKDTLRTWYEEIYA